MSGKKTLEEVIAEIAERYQDWTVPQQLDFLRELEELLEEKENSGNQK